MIRLAKEEDLTDVIRMCLDFKSNSPYASIELSHERLVNTLNNIINMPDRYVLFVATESDKIVGMLIGMSTEFLFSEDKIAGDLVWWVDPKHRNSRIGADLHYEFEQWAKSKDCKVVTMVLLEDENLEKVDKMYRRFGYRPKERSYMKEL